MMIFDDKDTNDSCDEPKHRSMEIKPCIKRKAPYYYIPQIRELYEPIMEFMYDTKEAYTYQIREAIANYFFLTEDEVEYRENDRYTVFQMRVNVVCYRLARRRLLENIGRGLYKISYLGEEALERRYDIDENYLKQIPEIEDDHEDSIKLPIPDKRYEYAPIEEVTIKEIHQARMQDTRFNNMLMMKALAFENGQIVDSVSLMVENKLCYKTDIKTGEKTVKSRSVEGYHKGSNAKDWSNPHPFINNPVGISGYNGGSSFGDILTDLMDNHYNISKTELSRRTGINDRTIQRMRTGVTQQPNVKDVYAIALTLEIPSQIFRVMLKKLRWDPNPDTPPDSIYMTIYGVNRGMSIKEINDACRQLGADEIYPLNME